MNSEARSLSPIGLRLKGEETSVQNRLKRCSARPPAAQQDRQVGRTDFAVGIKVCLATPTNAPVAKHYGQISRTDHTIAVQIGRADIVCKGNPEGVDRI